MMQRRRDAYLQPLSAVLLAGFLTLALALSCSANEQVTLQKSSKNPQTGAAEDFLDQANPSKVNANDLQVQSLTNANQRALVLFDFSLLPNVGIKSAQLTLTVQTAPSASRTYETFMLNNLFNQPSATWDTRVADLAWDTAGGDIGAATATTTVGPGTTQATWTITTDVQSWYSGNASGVPVPDYGTLIMDSAEGSGTAYQTVFYSNSAATATNAPALTVTFVQNVANLAATAGNGEVTLNWSYPAAIGTVINKTTGVLILRSSSGVPVNKGTVPTDGTAYAPCDTINGFDVVFNSTNLATTFTDSSSDTCGAPANGTTYYYKVFTQDSALNYSASGSSADGGSLSVPEQSSTPSATSSLAYSSNWITATYSTTLAPPSLFPGLVAVLGTQTNFVFGINANTGMRSYRVSLGGAITGRSPVIDAADSSLAEDMVYVADQSGLAYGIAADTGQTVWVVDPLNSGGTPFVAGGALLVKNYATSSYTLSHDLLVLGTRNTGTLTGNAIVAVDGNTGATVWKDVGSSGGPIPAMDIITAPPLISYTSNTIWVTSESNGGTQPSLWELNANTGKVLATLSLGDIDSSAVLTPDGSTLFVGNDAGTIYAINAAAATPTVITSIAGGDGEIVSYPLVVGFSSPYTVLFSGTADVHGLTYNSSTQTFTANWATAITTPSAPIGVFGLTDFYVGSGDGLIHELNINTGVDTRNIVTDTGQAAVGGDPALDLSLMHIYISTTDQRMYSFTFPY